MIFCCAQACQLAVVTAPRDSRALCLLGLAQLAQYDNNPNSGRSKEVITDACLSFQASIELEHKTQSGEPLEQLSSECSHSHSRPLVISLYLFWIVTYLKYYVCSEQKWWQDWKEAENQNAAKQSLSQLAEVKGLSDSSMVKRIGKMGRRGPGQGAPLPPAVTKSPAPTPTAPIRGRRPAGIPAKTPAAR